MTTMAENVRRRRIAATLYDKGCSFYEIADVLEVSYQVARNLVQPDRFNARVSLNKALADGEVERPDACEDCGRAVRLHGHHSDYNEPYKVRWLCAACHKHNHGYGKLGGIPLRSILAEVSPA